MEQRKAQSFIEHSKLMIASIGIDENLKRYRTFMATLIVNIEVQMILEKRKSYS